MRFLKIVKPSMRFGAVFRCREPYGAVRCYVMSYGPVRCGFLISPNLWCGAVRFSRRHKSYGAVRCGFQEGTNPTVRYGAVNRTEPHRTDRNSRTVKNPENTTTCPKSLNKSLNFGSSMKQRRPPCVLPKANV